MAAADVIFGQLVDTFYDFIEPLVDHRPQFFDLGRECNDEIGGTGRRFTLFGRHPQIAVNVSQMVLINQQ